MPEKAVAASIRKGTRDGYSGALFASVGRMTSGFSCSGSLIPTSLRRGEVLARRAPILYLRTPTPGNSDHGPVGDPEVDAVVAEVDCARHWWEPKAAHADPVEAVPLSSLGGTGCMPSVSLSDAYQNPT
jgi:hypothetical protein